MNMPVSMYRRWYFERNESFVVPNQFPQRAEVVAEAVGAVPQEVAAVARAVEAVPQEEEAVPQEVAAVALEEEAVPQEVAAVARAVEAVPQEVADEAAILSFDQYTGSHRRSVDEQMVLLDEYFNYLSSLQSASSVVAEPGATLENENIVVPNQFLQSAEVVAEAVEAVPQEVARVARAVEAVPQEVADEAAMLSFDQYTGSHRRSVDEQMVLLDEYFNYLSSFQSASSVVAESVATLESYQHVSEDNGGGGMPVELGAAMAGSGSLLKYSGASRVADVHSPPTEHNSANENIVVPNRFPQRAEVVAEAVEAVPQEVARVAQAVEAVPQEVARVAQAVEAVPQEVADEAAMLSFDQYTGSHRRSVDEQMVLLDEYFNYLSSFQSASSVVAEPVATLEMNMPPNIQQQWDFEVPDTLEPSDHVSVDNEGVLVARGPTAVTESGLLVASSEVSPVDSLNTLTEQD